VNRPTEELGLLETIRTRCAEVTRRAQFVRIEDSALDALAIRLVSGDEGLEEDLDPGHSFDGDSETQLAFTLLLDAINFGSGWFPVLAKESGMSGYRTVAAACKRRFESSGSPSASELRGVDARWMADMLGQDLGHPEVAELMEFFARAWREFGTWLGDRHGDRFESVVEVADHSAERLVVLLSELSLYQDVSCYDELDVPFYKRAQITAADLNRVFGKEPFGRFTDLDRLTLFADNLVPHVLRCHGVLVYEASLSQRIERAELLEVGSSEEIEIRAVAVEAVERLVAALGRLGKVTTAHALDGLLWNAGQAPEVKAHPRHRARCTFY
jgi:hypothetical protein